MPDRYQAILVPRTQVSGLQGLPGIYPASAAVTSPSTTPPPPTAASGTPSGYTTCAQENQTCSFSGQAKVAYGANGNFNYLTATSSIGCNNATFGDPIVGV